jgi:hypothetical protein
MQKDRDIISISCLGLFSHIATHKEGFQLEDPLKFRGGIGGCPLGVNVLDAHIPQFPFTPSVDQGMDQQMRGNGHTAHVDPVTRLHYLNRFLSSHKPELFHEIFFFYGFR